MEYLSEDETKQISGGVNNCMCIDGPPSYGPGYAPWIGEMRNSRDCYRKCCGEVRTNGFSWYGTWHPC